MKKGYQAILYIIIILILASGLMLFLWRDNALNYLNENTGVANLESTAKTTATSKDTLDSTILSDAKFLSLKNNVTKFDFESICKVPVGKVAVATVINSDGTQATASTTDSTATQQTGCILGNSIPFPVTVKKTD
jgi:hypothetical protein